VLVTSVSMMAVAGLVGALERAGVERASFLGAAGLSGLQLDDVHGRISAADYSRLVRAALERTGDAALGLHMGERAGMGSFDVLGHLGEHSRCLRDALELSARYASIVTTGPRLELHERGELATLLLTLPREDTPIVRWTAEFSSVGLLRMVRRFVGDDAQARRVAFAYPKPPHHAEYRRLFAGRERFSQAFTGVQLERAWLDRTQPGGSAELQALLQARADVLLARVEHAGPAADRVKRWLAAQSPRTRPTMDATARGLGMSARSLRRRLRDERAAFGELVDGALAHHAKRLLIDPRHSIQEAAYAMGFCTPSAFSRAFKRWTGMAPSQFRAQH
jgi:AraC-like DNA-binding protein